MIAGYRGTHVTCNEQNNLVSVSEVAASTPYSSKAPPFRLAQMLQCRKGG